MTAIPPGGAAEDCDTCLTALACPWVCPGHPEAADESEPSTEPLDLGAILARAVGYRETLDRVAALPAAMQAGVTTDHSPEADVLALLAALADRAEYVRRLGAIVARHVTGVALAEAVERAERAEAEVAEQAATIAGHEKAAGSDGRIIADLEAINDEVRAENERLRAAATRAADALDDLIANTSDPGVEALGARWELRHALRNRTGSGPLPTTEDYRVVLRDEADADGPSGGWQRVGSTEPTLDRAVAQMATRRRHHPEWDEMRVWRRQDVWSIAATEARDASRAPEGPADAPAPRATLDTR